MLGSFATRLILFPAFKALPEKTDSGYVEIGALNYWGRFNRFAGLSCTTSQIDLRYVISINGGTEQQSGEPFFGGGGGPGGGIAYLVRLGRGNLGLEASNI